MHRPIPLMALVAEHLWHNAMGLAPGLTKEPAKGWLDGVAQHISDLARIVETNHQGIAQTQYILQIVPARRLDRGVRHEMKVEVESVDMVNGDRSIPCRAEEPVPVWLLAD